MHDNSQKECKRNKSTCKVHNLEKVTKNYRVKVGKFSSLCYPSEVVTSERDHMRATKISPNAGARMSVQISDWTAGAMRPLVLLIEFTHFIS
jgi:hypothetical protein